MVSQTLALLQTWFTEPSAGNDRPKLLSKLAILEFCGWLEGWMDEFVLDLSRKCISDDAWVSENVIAKTHGFDYQLHLRPMICKVLGEHLTRSLEREYEKKHPGDIDHIKSVLGSLWKIRCSFAHADIASNVAAQATFYAPSWSLAQHKAIMKKLEALKTIGLLIASAADGGIKPAK